MNKQQSNRILFFLKNDNINSKWATVWDLKRTLRIRSWNDHNSSQRTERKWQQQTKVSKWYLPKESIVAYTLLSTTDRYFTKMWIKYCSLENTTSKACPLCQISWINIPETQSSDFAKDGTEFFMIFCKTMITEAYISVWLNHLLHFRTDGCQHWITPWQEPFSIVYRRG